MRLEAGADFADLFEVKDALDKKGEAYREVRDGELVLGYRRDDFVRETRITSGEPAEVTKDGSSSGSRSRPNPSGRRASTCAPSPRRPSRRSSTATTPRMREPNMAVTLEEWIEDAPALSCDADDVQHVYRKSLVDLAALRFYSILSRASRSRPPACRGS